MYVSVPKNYSGMAFSKEEPKASPPRQPPPSLPVGERRREEPPRQSSNKPCEGCKVAQKNPLACMMEALRNRNQSGFDTDDFLLIGLIVLLLGKEGNEDIILTLAMLLLI